MGAKTERITILGTPEFKAFLNAEAEKEGLNVSELVRRRFEPSADEAALEALIEEVNASTARAEASLEKGLAEAERVLAELAQARAAREQAQLA